MLPLITLIYLSALAIRSVKSVSVDKGSCILFKSVRSHCGTNYRDSNYHIHFIMKEKKVKLKQGFVRRVWNCIYETCDNIFF
jgi:hypothetical protein